MTQETNSRHMLIAKKYVQNWLRFVQKKKSSRNILKKDDSILIQNKEVNVNQINQEEKEIFEWFQQRFVNSAKTLPQIP